ncbi:hypothetical protein [Methylorubrum thiocyanatum]
MGRAALRSALARGPRTAVIGIVRLDAHGRIVERWDVMQILPETGAPPNGLFRELSVVRTSIAREMSHSTGIES